MSRSYLTIGRMLEDVSEPDRSILLRILSENEREFRAAPGSKHNHQAWPGGYLDHATETMNLVYVIERALGRPMSFSRSSALKNMFLHDIEKPWRFRRDERGRLQESLKSKREKKEFREGLMEDYGIVLTPDETNAMQYVEGEHRRAKPSETVLPVLKAIDLDFHPDFANAYTYIEGSHGDYRNSERTEGPLATFCHLWWTAAYGVLRDPDAMSPEGLHALLDGIRPLPFGSDDATNVIRLYKAAEKDRVPYEGPATVPNLRITEEAWNALLSIKRYPREDPLPFRMGPLAAFCHMCDFASARLWPHHPLAVDDPWEGARRSAS